LKQRVTSLILAFLLLLSSTGISLDLHFCGTELFEFSIIGNITTCGEIDTSEDSSKFKKVGCCTVDHFSIDTSDEYKKMNFDEKVEKLYVFQLFSVFPKNFVQCSVFSEVYEDFLPPPETKPSNLFLYHQCFII